MQPAEDDYYFFFFNDTATTEIYTLSLHDALPISRESPFRVRDSDRVITIGDGWRAIGIVPYGRTRSEEHTSELQSLAYLVCRLLLEQKNTMFDPRTA